MQMVLNGYTCSAQRGYLLAYWQQSKLLTKFTSLLYRTFISLSLSSPAIPGSSCPSFLAQPIIGSTFNWKDRKQQHSQARATQEICAFCSHSSDCEKKATLGMAGKDGKLTVTSFSKPQQAWPREDNISSCERVEPCPCLGNRNKNVLLMQPPLPVLLCWH